MKITKVESTDNPELDIKSLEKNKDNFIKRLLQEIILITKENKVFIEINKRILEVYAKRDRLESKNKKLDELLNKSESMKRDLIEKTELLKENNENYKSKLLELLGKGQEK